MSYDDEDEPLLLPLVKKAAKKARSTQAQSTSRSEHFLEVQLVNPNGQPLIFAKALITFDDGREYDRTSNESGVVRIDGLSKPGNYKVTLPALNARVGVTADTEDAKIVINKIDEVFAPSIEDLDIACSFRGVRYKKVTLEITSDSYDANPIYARLLTRDEKKKGDHTLYWSGQANCSGGDLKEQQYINPLYSPYKVRIYTESGEEAEKEFAVRYHSLKLAQGPWTADEQEPGGGNEKDWVQYKLNSLGYYAGPVGKDQDDYLRKAIIQYKANHKVLRLNEFNYGAYDDSITDALKTALESGDNPLLTVDSTVVGDASTMFTPVYVEAIAYQNFEEFTEFETKDKAAFEAERINRPLVPIEATVLLRDKSGNAVEAPSAVGPVRVDWTLLDCYGDSSNLPDHSDARPSYTKKYVEDAIAYQDEGEGDNCPTDFGGLRDNRTTDWHSCFFLDDSYEPYTAEKDEANKRVYSTACTDDANYSLRVGKAGIILRPSIIAGDAYCVTAQISFEGLANQQKLEQDHAGLHLDASTCIFEVIRRANISTMVGWPNRNLVSNVRPLGWQEMADEFEFAKHKVEYGSMTELGIGDALTVDEYRGVVNECCPVVTDNPDIFPPEDFALNPDWMMGVSLPEQGEIDGNTYFNAMKTFVSENYWKPMVLELGKVISKNIRKTQANGFVMMDVLAHEPITIYMDPSLPAGTPGNSATGWVFSIPSVGLLDGIFAIHMIDDKRRPPHHLLSHEMAHCLWMQHFEHTSTNFYRQHDMADHNCTMSYSSEQCGHGHHPADKFTSHFCGKCNLKLRGWDIRQLPASSDGNPQYDEGLPAVELLEGVQTRLNLLGFDSGVVDGLFGPITKGAVIAFQEKNKDALDVDGIPGPLTQAHLVKVYGA